MSARRFRLRLAPRAQRDVRGIRLYGLKQWGEGQADDYESALNRAMESLRANPRIGVARDNLLPGLRAYPVEHHVLYYRIVDDTIEVVRILHGRADAARHFPP
jgi:toxin ParE1/3/4